MPGKRTYLEPERKILINYDVDVLVVGGGTAGVATAVAAARNGAKTLLIERDGVLGGVATAGLMVSWRCRGALWDALGERVVTGIPWETLERVVKLGGATKNALKLESAPYKVCFDLEIFKRALLNMVEEAGVGILFHTFATNCISKKNKLKGVIIENKSGRQAIFAKQVIDASGDADIAFWSGVPCKETTGGHSLGHTLMFRMGGVDQEKTLEVLRENAHKIQDKTCGYLTWEQVEQDWERGYFHLGSWCLDDLRAMEPFRYIFEEAIAKGDFERRDFYLFDTAINIMIKEGEWAFDMQGVEGWAGTGIVDIWGAATKINGVDAQAVSDFEVFANRQIWKFVDKIIKRIPGFEKSYILDIASSLGVRVSRQVDTGYKFTREDIDNGTKFEDVIGRGASQNIPPKKVRGFDIPYRLIIPEKVDNLLVVGKPHTILRGMLTCMVNGEGAGTAAASAVQEKTTPRCLPIHELQKKLINQGVNLGRR